MYICDWIKGLTHSEVTEKPCLVVRSVIKHAVKIVWYVKPQLQFQPIVIKQKSYTYLFDEDFEPIAERQKNLVVLGTIHILRKHL